MKELYLVFIEINDITNFWIRKGKANVLGLDLESGRRPTNEQDNDNFVKEREEETLKEEMLSQISDTEVRLISELKVGVLGRCKQGLTHSPLSTDI